MMCRQMIRLLDAPSARAASTYSFSRSDMNSARMMRDVVSHETRAMISARMKMLDDPKRRPSTAATTQQRDGEHHVDEAHDARVGLAPVVAGEAPRTVPMTVAIRPATTAISEALLCAAKRHGEVVAADGVLTEGMLTEHRAPSPSSHGITSSVGRPPSRACRSCWPGTSTAADRHTRGGPARPAR